MTHSQQFLAETQEIAKLIDSTQIEKMVGELKALRERGGRLFLVGLGGSAANCSHAVNDFRKLCGIEAYTPVDNVAELTARANDDGWDESFLTWDLGYGGHKNDVLMVLSVGGGTERVSRPLWGAIQRAKDHKMRVLGIVGKEGGFTKLSADVCVVIPTVNPKHVTPHVEGWQLVILHCLVSHPDLQTRPTKW